MLPLEKLILKRTVSIIFAFRLTGTQTLSCYFVNSHGTGLYSSPSFSSFCVAAPKSFSSSIMSGLILSSVILEVALAQKSSFKKIYF